MNCRRHGTKSTVAFWMLVAAADVALIVASAGLTAVLFALVVAAVVTAAVLGRRLVSQQRGATVQEPVPVQARATRRRV